MAGLHCSALPVKSIIGFHGPLDRARTFLNVPLLQSAPPPTHFTLRSRNNVRLLLSQSLFPVYASKGSTSEGSDVTKSSEAAKGPPFLTILAGFLVFAALFWVIGSIVMWLISLIFHVPPSK